MADLFWLAATSFAATYGIILTWHLFADQHTGLALAALAGTVAAFVLAFRILGSYGTPTNVALLDNVTSVVGTVLMLVCMVGGVVAGRRHLL